MQRITGQDPVPNDANGLDREWPRMERSGPDLI